MPRSNSKSIKGSFTTPFTQTDLKKLSSGLKSNENAKPPKIAYKITFSDQPDLVYISFQTRGNKDTTRAKARWEATKYFRDNMHWSFQKEKNYTFEMHKTITKRLPELDKYGEKGKVPIPELMKALNTTFPCSVCGKDNFNYEDYEIGRCFLLEGEGDLNVFTQGIILCYDCYKKYLK